MLPCMPGAVALVGSGEFLPAMSEFDAGLLAATGRTRPRVAILPTASWPDGEEAFARWASMGVAHFSGLGAEVEPVRVRDRADADDAAHVQAIGEADLIYLSGGKPGHLSSVLDGSGVGRALRQAHLRGAVIAGCSAGAMALADRHFDMRRRRLMWPVRWRDGLGLVAGRVDRAALRRLAGAAVGPARAPGAARIAPCSGSTRRPHSSAETDRGRSTAELA